MEIVKLKVPSSMLGLTVGLLLGFSSTPVVGGVLSSLLTGAFILMSLVPDTSKVKLNRFHIAAVPYFVVALLFGAGAGLYMKSNSVLFPSPIQIDFTNLVKIGIGEDEARIAVLSKYSEGEITGLVTGIQGVGTPIQVSQIDRIAQANATIMAILSENESSVSSQVIQTQTEIIAYRLRDILENSIGQKAAFLWHEWHVSTLQEQGPLLEKMQRENRDEYEKIQQFFMGNNL